MATTQEIGDALIEQGWTAKPDPDDPASTVFVPPTLQVSGSELRDGDVVYVEGDWLPLEEVTHHADLSVLTAFSGNRELYFAVDGYYGVRRV